MNNKEIIKILQENYMPAGGLTWVEEGPAGHTAVVFLMNGLVRVLARVRYDPCIGAILMHLPNENFTRVFGLDRAGLKASCPFL